MGNRLNPEIEKALDLVETAWNQVRKYGIQMIYIRSHPTAPVYGPYQVLDPVIGKISCTDGSSPGRYPRDKGLLVRKTDIDRAQREAAAPTRGYPKRVYGVPATPKPANPLIQPAGMYGLTSKPLPNELSSAEKGLLMNILNDKANEIAAKEREILRLKKDYETLKAALQKISEKYLDDTKV